MMKLITPLIHVAFLIPLTGIAVGVEAFLRSAAVLGEYKGVIDLPLFIMFLSSIIIFGIPLFWLANLLMQRFEKPHGPTVYDHFRQSLFFYLIVIYSSATWIARGFGNTEEDGYLLLWIGISLVGIVVNYKFLSVRRKVNVT